MKKTRFTYALISMIISLGFTGNSFADIKPLVFPQGTCSITAYNAKIVGADINYNSPQKITIITTGNETNQSRIERAAITFTDKDIPMGLTLANSVGKNIQTFFLPGKLGQCNTEWISIMSEGYWNLP